MDSMQAMLKGQANLGKPHRVFDWDKAAGLIRDQRPAVASAGLGNDWEYTGGVIYRDGTPVPHEDTYVYLESNWAIPQLDMDGRLVGCWKWQEETPGWHSGTYWPESARAILNGED